MDRQIADRLLDAAYRLSTALGLHGVGKAVSEKIWSRRMDRKWQATKAAHIAAGGVCMAVQSDAGTQEILL